MIRVSETIPNIKVMRKVGTKVEWMQTHDVFKDKKILLIGLPGLFLVEYASTQLKTYQFMKDKILSLGIDEIWFTSVNDCYVQKAQMVSDDITEIPNLPDPSGEWAEAIGMLEDMSREGLGKYRSHRYAMIIDNLLCKTIKYEDFSFSPMTSYLVTDPISIIKYLEGIQTNYEQWNDDAREKVDNLGRQKRNTVLP